MSLKRVVEGEGSIPLIKVFSKEANSYQAGTFSCFTLAFVNILQLFNKFLLVPGKKKHRMA